MERYGCLGYTSENMLSRIMEPTQRLISYTNLLLAVIETIQYERKNDDFRKVYQDFKNGIVNEFIF